MAAVSVKRSIDLLDTVKPLCQGLSESMLWDTEASLPSDRSRNLQANFEIPSTKLTSYCLQGSHERSHLLPKEKPYKVCNCIYVVTANIRRNLFRIFLLLIIFIICFCKLKKKKNTDALEKKNKIDMHATKVWFVSSVFPRLSCASWWILLRTKSKVSL